MRSAVVCLVFAVAQVLPSGGTDALRRLEAKLPVRLVQPSALADLAGRYTGQSPELEKRVGPFLTGEDLYLFPDGSYLYCEWGDVMPTTVYDKGRWSAAGGVLELVSDKDIRWDPEVDRRHVIVRREARGNEVMLVGLPGDLDYFEQKTGDDPELTLLIVGMLRTDGLDKKTAPAVKAKLMKEAWQPTFFRKRLPPNPRLQPAAHGL